MRYEMWDMGYGICDMQLRNLGIEGLQLKMLQVASFELRVPLAFKLASWQARRLFSL